MNSRSFLKVILLCLVFNVFVCSCKSFGDPIIGAKGAVKDVGGNPIQGATVTIEQPGSMPRKKVTEKDGLYEVSLIGAVPEKTKISFTKAGYKTVEKGFETEGRKEFDVTLEPETK